MSILELPLKKHPPRRVCAVRVQPTRMASAASKWCGFFSPLPVAVGLCLASATSYAFPLPNRPSREKEISPATLNVLLYAFVVVVLGVMLLNVTSATAGIINAPMETFWQPMPQEGYLEHKINPTFGRWGQEYTGWVDVRHPAMDSTTNVYYPYDRSDHYTTVHTTVCSDSTPTSAAPDRQRDFDFSNKIYGQSGISVIREPGNATLSLDGTSGSPNVTWPINQTDQDDAMKCLSRSSNGDAVNAWYVKQYDDDKPNGLASPPRNYGGNTPRNDGIGIADAAVSSTFAHEVGHMLLNGDPSEDNSDATNFMYRSGSDYGLTDIGKTKGCATDAQTERLYLNGGANNPGFVKKNNDHPKFGMRVDWDFTANDNQFESMVNGADDFIGAESMYWGIGHTSIDPTTGHDHTGLPDFPTISDFDDQYFLYVDIFSLTLRYLDFDGSELYSREGATDYYLLFVDCNDNLAPGTPVVMFEFGWTAATCVDNYLVRWKAPFEAVGLYIWGGSDDYNCQIDAVLAATIPEPATVLLLGLGGLALLRRRSSK